MSGESNADEVLEGGGGPNGSGVLVMGHADDDLSGDVGAQVESPQSMRSGDKEGAAADATDDSSDQDSSYVQVDRVENSNDSVHTDSDDMKVPDDAGKEDMFVDAPDELGASAPVTDSDETVERSIEGTQFYEESGIPAYHLVDEVEHLRSMLKKVTAERDALSQEKQEGWLQKEIEIKELQEQLDLRDKEINDFTAKMISHELLRESSEVLNQNVQYVDAVLNQLLASLATVVFPGDLFDDSIAAKASLVERSSSMLVQNYTEVLSDVEQLRQVLNHRMVTGGQENFRTVLTATRDELFELRAKEAELLGKLNYLEGQNEEFFEQMEKSKGTVESMNNEVAKLRSELEQEKGKSATLREKLSLAVTKGKGLVQQRDSLRQSLAEKTHELEERFEELLEKSRALEACELRNGDLLSNENLIASLQEALSQKDAIFTNIEELLSQGTLPDSTQFQDLSEKVKWLLEDRSTLVGAFLEWQRIRDAISSLDIPETVASLDVVSVIRWLNESIHLEKGECMKLQDEILRMKEAGNTEIHRLSTSHSEEIRERDLLKEELADLSEKLETAVQKEQHLLQERSEAAKILQEASGMTLDNQEKMSVLVAICLSKTAEQTSQATESSHVEAENFERAVTLLYLKDLELTLCLLLLEEDHSERSQVMKDFDDLNVAAEGLATVKEERDSLQKDLSRAEEKVSTLREKLSMAVKKGKGLVQERENMKGHFNEKNQEIDKLMFEVQRQESLLSEYTDQINRLSADVEHIPKLVADVVSIKDQKNQLEELLEVNNQKLRGIIEIFDGIALPTTLEFEEPLEKLKWIESYLNESEKLKTETGKELEKLKQEASHQDVKFAESHSAINSLQDALLQKESDLSQIAEEKKELEAVKASIEQELQKITEESQDQSRKVGKVSASLKSLQDALSQAENDIQKLSVEKVDLSISKACAEMELEKVNEEMATQTNKLTEAYNSIRTLEDSLSHMTASISRLTEQSKEKQEGSSSLELELQKLRDEVSSQAGQLADAHSTIKFLEVAAAKTDSDTSVLTAEKKIEDEEIISLNFKLEEAYENIKALEDSISHMQATVSVLTEENSEGQLSRSNLESEVQRLKDEMSYQEASLADAQSTIKLLEDAALEAKNSMSTLLVQKKTAENEISVLQSKLTACQEELSGTHESVQSKSLEFIGLLRGLKTVALAETLASLSKRFEAPVEKLKNMDLILEEIKDHFAGIGHPVQKYLGSSKVDLSISQFLRDVPSINASIETANSDIDSANVDEVNKLFNEVVDWLHQKDRYIEDFSAALDASTDAILNKLQSSNNEMVAILGHMASLKRTMEDLELGMQKRDQTISALKNDLHILVSACAEAEKNLLHQSPELEPASHELIFGAMGDEVDLIIEREARESNKYITAAKKLLLTTQEVHSLKKQMENSGEVANSTISNLQNELTVLRASLEEITQQRNVNLNRLSNLEADLQSSQSLSSKMSLKIEDLQMKEEKLMEKEAEALLLYNNLSSKEQELKDCQLTLTQLRELLDTASGIEFPFEESGDLYPHGLTLVKKLSYILDNYPVLQQKLDILSGKKDELQSTIGKQTSEIQNLKEEILEHGKNIHGSQKLKNQFSEFTLHLERMVLKLGGSDTSGDLSAEDAKRLLLVLDKLLSNLVSEYENSKSIARELEAKSVESRKIVDSLSMKVQSLEEVTRCQTIVPQTIQERSLVLPSTSAGSEISEVEEVDLSGKSAITPVPSAAQIRTLRKGSTDHLALNIDVESAPLVNSAETDDDKGHVFKSLNTSGLIPKQGKLLADRIDGIWVNGGRVLMNQPRARLGVIAYWLALHIWLLASIL